MSEIIELLKTGIQRIESAEKTKKEEFVLILGLLEDFYQKCYEEQCFVQLNIDRISRSNKKDLQMLKQRILSGYAYQVEELVNISDPAEVDKTVKLFEQALDSLKTSLNAVSREIQL